MIAWCNTNQGFLSAILAVVTIIISVIAIKNSFSAAKMQSQAQLLQQRITTYSQINRIYSIIKRYVEIAEGKPYLTKSHFASVLLYPINSPQEKVCEKIQKIKKSLEAATDGEEKDKLLHEWMEISNEMVPYVLEQMTSNTQLKETVRLFYSDDIQGVMQELIDIFGLFSIAHFDYENRELNESIEEMKKVILEMETLNTMEKIEKQTLNRKYFK